MFLFCFLGLNPHILSFQLLMNRILISGIDCDTEFLLKLFLVLRSSLGSLVFIF